jgi:hypothetical protein
MLEPGCKDAIEYRKNGRNDCSPSSYDMSLANYAARAGWSEQEIVNLLIWVRRNHHVDLKLRHDYYSRTLARAKASVRREASANYLQDLDAAKAESNGAATPPSAELKAHMSTLLGLEIKRVVRVLTDPPDYSIDTNMGHVPLGGITNLMEQIPFRRRVADTTKHLIPLLDKDQWFHIAAGLLAVSEDESAGEEATVAGWTHTALRDYAEEVNFARDRQEGLSTRTPWKEDDLMYFFLADFRDWLSKRRRETLSTKELALKLKTAGAKSGRRDYANEDGSRSSRNVFWVRGVTDAGGS